jgi:hypothetical protein
VYSLYSLHSFVLYKVIVSNFDCGLHQVIQCVRKIAVHLGYGTSIWLSLSKLPLKCAVVSLYSLVKQRLRCNTDVCE